MAPPCGTASRARDRPIPVWLRRQGVPSPPPLRSAQYPSGLPDLHRTDLTRVELANACYATAARVFKYGHCKGVYVFIENPTNSYMWMVPCIAELFQLAGVYFTTFQVCVHGGERDKKTSLLHNCKQLCQLGVMCDRQRTHKGWSVSKTLTMESGSMTLLAKLNIRCCCANALPPSSVGLPVTDSYQSTQNPGQPRLPTRHPPPGGWQPANSPGGDVPYRCYRRMGKWLTSSWT